MIYSSLIFSYLSLSHFRTLRYRFNWRRRAYILQDIDWELEWDMVNDGFNWRRSFFFVLSLFFFFFLHHVLGTCLAGMALSMCFTFFLRHLGLIFDKLFCLYHIFLLVPLLHLGNPAITCKTGFQELSKRSLTSPIFFCLPALLFLVICSTVTDQ